MRRASLAIYTSLIVSCASTDVGNPIDTEISFAAYEGSAADPQALTLDNGVVLERALIKVRGFQLDRSENCDDANSSFDEVVRVDLVSGLRSDVPFWDDEAGTFCRLRIQFSNEAVGGEPAELVGASMYIEGSVDGNAFSLRLEETPAMSLAGPFTLPKGSHLLQVGFFPNEWFRGQVLDSLLSEDSEASQADVSLEFWDNVLGSARLYHDSNEDGVLDVIELSTSLAEGE